MLRNSQRTTTELFENLLLFVDRRCLKIALTKQLVEELDEVQFELKRISHAEDLCHGSYWKETDSRQSKTVANASGLNTYGKTQMFQVALAMTMQAQWAIELCQHLYYLHPSLKVPWIQIK